MKRQWALITGASSGIGYQYARVLANKGYDLIIVSNEEQEIISKGKLLSRDFGVDVHPVCMDLATTDAAEKLFRFCKDNKLQVGILINNAGMFSLGEIVDSEASRNEKILTLHMHTPTMLCHYFGQVMKQEGRGHILNMSSMAAWLPYSGIGLYAASKRYLKNFSRSLRTELKDYGVHVTTVCPGAIATDLYNLPQHYQRLALRLGVMMTPEKLAAKGIRAMFHRRACILPGTINYILLPLARLTPLKLVHILMRKSGLLPLTKTEK